MAGFCGNTAQSNPETLNIEPLILRHESLWKLMFPFMKRCDGMISSPVVHVKWWEITDCNSGVSIQILHDYCHDYCQLNWANNKMLFYLWMKRKILHTVSLDCLSLFAESCCWWIFLCERVCTIEVHLPTKENTGTFYNLTSPYFIPRQKLKIYSGFGIVWPVITQYMHPIE